MVKFGTLYAPKENGTLNVRRKEEYIDVYTSFYLLFATQLFKFGQGI